MCNCVLYQAVNSNTVTEIMEFWPERWPSNGRLVTLVIYTFLDFVTVLQISVISFQKSPPRGVCAPRQHTKATLTPPVLGFQPTV